MSIEVKNKRGWVKNAAIIFLSVMLVLTFFSNTILNWSLPEVSGQYAGYGQIKTAVTGSGTVTARQNYKISLDVPRTIDSILVREGDTVSEGDVLFILEEYENEELKAAEKALEDMEYSYQVKILNREDSEYTENLENIAELEEKLSELKEQRIEAEKQEQLVKGSEEIVKIYENESDKYTQLVSELEEEYSLLTSGEAANSEVISSKMTELENKEKELERAQENYDLRKEEYDEIESEIDTPYSSAEANYNSANSLYQSASQELSYLQADYNSLVSANNSYNSIAKKLEKAESSLDEKKKELDSATLKHDNALDYYETVKADPEKEPTAKEELNNAKSELEKIKEEYDDAKGDVDTLKEQLDKLNSVSSAEITSAKRALDKQKDTVDELSRALAKARSELNAARNDKDLLDDAQERLKLADDVLKKVQKEVKALQEELDDLLSDEAKKVKDEIKTNKNTLKAVNAKLDEENKKLADLKKDVDASTEQLDNEIESIEKDIKKAKDSVTKLEEEQSKDDTLFSLEIARDLKAIEEQKTKIEKLKEKTYSNEVVTKNSGVIASVNVYAGLDVTPGEILAEIELSGSGYVLEIPVTLEQSRKINVGDKVNVTNYYWGDNIDMTVSEIRTDRTNPNSGRTVVISVEGDVNFGRTFEVSIGERTASYDLVVPNSAIREDADGKYILIASVRNTPLGNRYIAKRIDVTVVEKDNINSAVDTSYDYNYEYVITSSTAPIADGSQVRLVENG